MALTSSESNKRWWITSTKISCAAVGLLGLGFLLPVKLGVAVIAIGLATFFVLLYFNPQYRYMRAATSLLTMWIGSRSFPTVISAFSSNDSSLSFQFQSNVSSAFDISCAMIVVVLIVLDYRVRDTKSPTHILCRKATKLFSIQRQQAHGSSRPFQFGDVIGDNNYINIVTSDEKSNFSDQIDVAAKSLESGQLEVAIHKLEEIKKHNWDRLSPREKFRVLANLGHAKCGQGEIEQSAKCYLDAKAFQPDDEQALALESLAYFLLRDDSKARELAQAVLDRFPNSEIATNVFIRTESESAELSEIEARIPKSIRSAVNVLVALHSHAMQTDKPVEAVKYARELKENLDLNCRASGLLGAALARKALLAYKGQIESSKDEFESDLREAVDNLTQQINDKTSNKMTKNDARYYRAIAHDLSGSASSAESDYRFLIEDSKASPEVFYQFGLFLVRNERAREAVEYLQIASSRNLIGASLTLAEILAESANAVDKRDALDLLRSLEERVSEESDENLFFFYKLFVRCVSNHSTPEEVDEVLCSAKQRLSAAAFMTIQSLQYWRRREPERSLKFARMAADELSIDTSSQIQFVLARHIVNLGDIPHGLSILKQIITISSSPEDIALAVDCAYKCDDAKFGITFCQELRIANKSTPFIVETEIEMISRLGGFEKSLNIIDEYLIDPQDLRFAESLRVRKWLLLKQLHRQGEFNHTLQELPDVERVGLKLGCVVASLIAEQFGKSEGANYAYALLRRFFGEADAHMCFCSIVGIGGQDAMSFEAPPVVSVGTAVCYKDPDGKLLWVIIENTSSVDSYRAEINQESTLAKELIGKSKGESFYLRRDIVQDRVGVVVEILDKLDYRRRDVIDKWEERFPEIPFIRKYNFVDENGQLDIQRFVESISKIQKEVDEIDKMVLAHPFSACVIAKISRTSVLETVMRLSASKDCILRCCSGVDEEYQEAIKDALEHGAAVIDITALSTLYRTGLYQRLEDCSFRLYVARRSIEVFQRLLDDKHHVAWAKMSVGVGDRGVDKHEQSEEGIERNRKYLSLFLKWIQEHCVVMSAFETLALISGENRKRVVELCGDEVLEGIAVALSEGIPIWADDIVVGSVGAELGVRGYVWTDVLMDLFHNQGYLTEDERISTKVALLDAGYHFTRVELGMVPIICEASKWDSSARPLSMFIKWLHKSGVSPRGALALAAETIKHSVASAPLADQYIAILRSVIRSVGLRVDAVDVLMALQYQINNLLPFDTHNRNECYRMIREVLNRVSRQRPLILPGHLDWPT